MEERSIVCMVIKRRSVGELGQVHDGGQKHMLMKHLLLAKLYTTWQDINHSCASLLSSEKWQKYISIHMKIFLFRQFQHDCSSFLLSLIGQKIITKSELLSGLQNLPECNKVPCTISYMM